MGTNKICRLYRIGKLFTIAWCSEFKLLLYDNWTVQLLSLGIFVQNNKGFPNECASLARWHRHICTLFICILGACRHTVMMPRGINYTIVHHTSWSIHVQAPNKSGQICLCNENRFRTKWLTKDMTLRNYYNKNFIVCHQLDVVHSSYLGHHYNMLFCQYA